MRERSAMYFALMFRLELLLNREVKGRHSNNEHQTNDYCSQGFKCQDSKEIDWISIQMIPDEEMDPFSSKDSLKVKTFEISVNILIKRQTKGRQLNLIKELSAPIAQV
ncbi:hypothetical protein LOTGIDRAFT_175878 [Lottia gigantea]|uniref:Uncharacterized protein n=1 Tax=Lottia gigantea TaxID=225164 RepID=V4A5I7_LOTGI|nr:hypothetical protein LOTGIDRAFT_175878 [Lottia gigantea]ESO88521.1 hypothetical protein LOTGIDRAFT_175878 [Lottia gigantea]